MQDLQAGRAAWVPSARDFHIVEVPEELRLGAGRSVL
jgi:hypothetical protein